MKHIPWDEELAKLYARGEPVVPHSARWREMFEDLWGQIEDALNKEKQKPGKKEVDTT